MKNKNNLKHSTRVIISLGIGFVLAMIVMFIGIFIGYTYAYKSGVDVHMVNIFGIGIYTLNKNGNIYSGTAIGKSMGALCAIFMVCSMIVEECISKIRNK